MTAPTQPGVSTRRRALLLGLGGAATAAGVARADGDEDVGPGEDLMREHGVLRRVLLVHDEVVRTLRAGKEVDPQVLQRTGKLIRSFVEDYHERQEEQFVFPRFERAKRLVPLVETLRAQHQAGRAVTDRVLALATAANLKQTGTRDEPITRHDVMSRREYDALGEQFERRERQIFHGDGFERAVAEVDAMEKLVGLEDLARFTPGH